jgi:hypothetical protein
MLDLSYGEALQIKQSHCGGYVNHYLATLAAKYL